jgi:cobalt-zinc-cadmium efflux system outer membrane protein
VRSGEFSLDATVSLAVAQNPSLVALRQTERVGEAALGVARTYPFNPYVQVQSTPYQRLDNRDFGQTSHYVLLMQRLQLAHQQLHRENAAVASLNGVRWTFHQAELRTVALAAQSYFSVLYQRGLLDVARASQRNNERLLEAIEKRFEAGDASAADVATVRVDTNSTEQQLHLAEANYQTALRDLRRQLGLSPDSATDFAGDLRMMSWRLPSAEAYESLTSGSQGQPQRTAVDNRAWIAGWAGSRPDVMAARANVDVARANLRLASAYRVPDLQLGPYYQRDPDGMTRVGFRGEVELPVVNCGEPLEAQRAAELRQQTVIWEQALLQAELEAQAALERYELAFEALDLDGGRPTFDLPAELQSLERQFVAGEVDVVRIIQARTSILQNQRAQLDMLNELAQSAALLVGATGMPFELLVGP